MGIGVVDELAIALSISTPVAKVVGAKLADGELGVLAAAAGTLESASVPHALQVSDSGLAVWHCEKAASQMKLGKVPKYCAMFEGPVPLEQVHV